MKPEHVPVTVQAVIDYLVTRAGGVYLDCTVGAGGHAAEVLRATSPDGRLIGIDVDGQALALAKENLSSYRDRVSLARGNFSNLDQLLDQQGVSEVDGILMDLGASAMQLDAPDRGFSFRKSGPLDMRMDQDSGQPVSRDINEKDLSELARIIRVFGEDRWANRIATGIVKAREKSPIKTTEQLAEIVEKSVPRSPSKIHPATRTFQSFRIYKNDEITNLKTGLDKAIPVLKSGGRICVISFHSLEDRVVKHTFRALERGCICPPRAPVCVCGRKPVIRILTKRPVTAQAEEVEANPRARSAKLRAAEKL